MPAAAVRWAHSVGSGSGISRTIATHAASIVGLDSGSVSMVNDLGPGRALDRAIAEQVMGYTVHETDECNGSDNLWLKGTQDERGWEQELPEYSTNFDDAMTVVDTLREIGLDVVLMKLKGRRTWNARAGSQTWCDGESWPHAICLAALSPRFE